ncbi:MAG: hypothetical protein KZQ70_02590 [gamma proteobacterium symbiont of Lucinoma myriamae]|nr:hypothetical protein [gamma proteobacterium symbiont of Lucinoma myriamae]MCU7820064.1 hypothetical protein [gamma proteobacterium symbiont of Lucinoma myriamae]MCU7831482.1 hypothetical protein [gamma proteobacterium symbiont of Lucinoma myriamae]
MDKQRDNLKKIEELTIKLNHALQNIDEPTKTKLEAHNLQVSGISMSLLRIQIGVDNTLNDTKRNTIEKTKKTVITKIT